MAVAARNELGVMVTSRKDAISTCAIARLQCCRRGAGYALDRRQAKLAPGVPRVDNATVNVTKPSLHQRRSWALETEIGSISLRNRNLRRISDLASGIWHGASRIVGIARCVLVALRVSKLPSIVTVATRT